MAVASTRLLVADYIMFRLRRANLPWDECPQLPEPGPVQRTMQVLGEAFEERYTEVFQGMADSLHLTPNTAQDSFMRIVNELFSDGIRWGRIVALVAFGGALSVQCIQLEMPGLVNDIVDWVTEYIDIVLMSWIQEQGGWVSSVVYVTDNFNCF
jgi:hypothetical protein